MAQDLLPLDSIAPDFTLLDCAEDQISLNMFRGKKVLLYFYPRDDTPGCTLEAKEFTALQDQFEEHNTVILGVSGDSVLNHCQFRDKHNLTVLLLSDEDKAVCKLYHVWQKKKFMGKEFDGIVRTTYLIDEQGKIIHLWPKVKSKGHAQQVLNHITSLS